MQDFQQKVNLADLANLAKVMRDTLLESHNLARFKKCEICSTLLSAHLHNSSFSKVLAICKGKTRHNTLKFETDNLPLTMYEK